METKKCKQCGEIKPLSNFRPYYSGSGTYTVCNVCEKINSRAKYLTRKGDKATDADRAELARIQQLYQYQRLVGLKPPQTAAYKRVVDELDRLLNNYKNTAEKGPEELRRWLTEELTEDPDYYNDHVYERLLSKYRPMIRVDSETLTPVYDETYATELNQILERFNKYEDEYYK